MANAAWSMGIDVSRLGVVFTNAFVIVGALALFLLPGGQVGWDALYWAVFTGATDASAPDAAAITVLTQVQQSLLIVLGIVALLAVARGIAGGMSRGL